MKVLATCKVCRNPVILVVDDAYMELGDPNNLIPMACHDPCAWKVLEHMKLLEGFAKVCMDLYWSIHVNEKTNREEWRENVTYLTKRYCEWMAKSNGMSGTDWQEDFVNMILERPGQWHKILDEYRKQWRINNDSKKRLVPAQAEAALPYHDSD